jgi:hypothetical protein
MAGTYPRSVPPLLASIAGLNRVVWCSWLRPARA